MRWQNRPPAAARPCHQPSRRQAACPNRRCAVSHRWADAEESRQVRPKKIFKRFTASMRLQYRAMKCNVTFHRQRAYMCNVAIANQMKKSQSSVGPLPVSVVNRRSFKLFDRPMTVGRCVIRAYDWPKVLSFHLKSNKKKLSSCFYCSRWSTFAGDALRRRFNLGSPTVAGDTVAGCNSLSLSLTQMRCGATETRAAAPARAVLAREDGWTAA